MSHSKSLILGLVLTLLACETAPLEVQSVEPQGTPSAEMLVDSAEPPTEEPAPVEPAPELTTRATMMTRFKAGPKFESRVTNITKIATMLDGLQLLPGEEFSFNESVGPRTLERGFKNAPSYFMGEIIEGVGGGACQVSSTLYAAALYANLEVLERRPHSRVSSYIDPGLDATVNYPAECWDAETPDKRVCYDLKFKNPYDFDLVFKFEIGSEVDGKRSLQVSVLGTGYTPEVTTRWRAFLTPPFETRYRKVPWWDDDRKKLDQTGKPGLHGVLDVTVKHEDGKKDLKKVHSQYEPVPEVWKVGALFEIPTTETTPTMDAP